MAAESNAERAAREYKERKEKDEAETKARRDASTKRDEEKAAAEKQKAVDEESARKAALEEQQRLAGKGGALYDVRNPTRAPRVFYDGINEKDDNGNPRQQIAYTLPPGGVRKNVRLDESFVKEMAERNEHKKDSDLIIVPAGSMDDDADKKVKKG